MRVIRVRYKDQTFYASLIDEKSVLCLNQKLGLTDPIPLAEISLLPVVWPTKIVCAGMNYRGHAEELGRPVPEEPALFLKPPSSVIGNGQAIVMPQAASRVDYEGELALVMGQSCRNATPEEAAGCVFGYTCANDVTARDLQERDGGLFGRCKGFDTFCPIGPWIETEMENPDNLGVITRVNDEIKQQANTSDMVFTPLELVSYVSQVMTLLPGDVVLTGTPSGIGPLTPGDEVRVEIENVGLLINQAVAESEPAKRDVLQ
jgi:2-keto-4-pentenoate hydratase/2-oxohepta-3-ene-1,7-dioic acid hydratase in catechol pathway